MPTKTASQKNRMSVSERDPGPGLSGWGSRPGAPRRTVEPRCASVRPAGEEGEYGVHAAVLTGAGGEGQLVEDARDVLFDGMLGDDELFADALVRAPFGHQGEHLAL